MWSPSSVASIKHNILSLPGWVCRGSKILLDLIRELTEDKPKIRCWSSFLGYPQVVTHVYVHGAEGLQNQDSAGGERTKTRQTSLQICTFYFLAEHNEMCGNLHVATQVQTPTSSFPVRAGQ